jgi:enterochelin esterase-like enzyme
MCGTKPQFRSEVVYRSTFTAEAPAGTLDMLTYRTHDYYTEGQTRGYAPLTKKMMVYLPYGYDPSEKYDLMILMHGMGGTETYWLQNVQQVLKELGHGVYTVGMLNNLMNSGYCRKMIIACPCFYRDGNNQLDYFLPRDEDQFVRELREDILPLLVDTYSTYARSSSQEDISAAREHFAYAGLSMGSIYAYTSIMPKCLDLFAWYGCFSGSDADLPRLVNALRAPENADYPILYFYNCIGDRDSMFDTHTAQYADLVATVDCLTDGKNAAMTVIRDASHEYRAWGTGLYNFLRVVFAQPAEP